MALVPLNAAFVNVIYTTYIKQMKISTVRKALQYCGLLSPFKPANAQPGTDGQLFTVKL